MLRRNTHGQPPASPSPGTHMKQPVEQLAAAARTAVDDVIDVSTTQMAGLEKLVELNMATAKAALSDTAELMQTMLSAKSPQDLTAVATAMAEKAAAYGQAVAGIMTETGAALAKAAEGKFSGVQAQTMATIDAALKQAPAGSEGFVAAFKNAMTTGQAAFESAQASTRTAVAGYEKSVATVTEMATKATKGSTKKR